MNREHEAGKGDASRVKDLKAFGKGYDYLRWPSKTKKKESKRVGKR